MTLPVTTGFAASMAVSGTVGAGMANTRCDADGYRLVPVLASGTITSVTVQDLALDCAGATITVQLTTSASGTSSGSLTVPSGGTPFDVALSPAVAMTPVVAVAAVVV